MSILKYFPGTPRKSQSAILLRVEEEWEKNDVFIIDAPVSFGKSRVAVCITRWAASKNKTTSILTKDRVLVNQYIKDFPRMAKLLAKRDYPCVTHKNAERASKFFKKEWKSHREAENCTGCSSYISDLRRAQVSKTRPIPLLCNMHVHLAHKMSKDVLLIDEAHNLVTFLQELHTKKWWQHDIHYPEDSWTRKDFQAWMVTLRPDQKVGMKLLEDELNRESARFILTRDVEPYFNKNTECLKMVPFDIRGEAPFMWPQKRTKLVFLSATMNHKDLERIGLEDRRWVILSAGSAIPTDRRPVHLDAVESVTYARQESKVPHLLDFIDFTWNHYGRTKGLVHLTYGMSEQLKSLLRSSNKKELRSVNELPFVFHTAKDKMQRLKEWMATDSGILVACGLSEGLDLYEDLARWQIIGKVPWPSLGNPVLAEWARRDHEAYLWETLKQVIQMSGRVCRGPADFGATHIFDSQILRLLKESESAKIVPKWWKDAVRDKESVWQTLERT